MIVVLPLVFLALHLPYLPKSLEDLDSINFALGVRHFDVAHHQPHPPGYPVFILIAKALHAVVPAEATALALFSAIAAALGVLGLAVLYHRLDEDDVPGRWSAAAAGVAMKAVAANGTNSAAHMRSNTVFFTEKTPPQAMRIWWNPGSAISRLIH